MKAVILAHGKMSNYDVALKECSNCDIIICADGGAEYAKINNIRPNYLMGDFDSISEDVLKYYEIMGTEIIKFPQEKDYTDTELCIGKALELKCDEICILAGVGGRIDHSLGNIGLLHVIAEKKVSGYIANDDCYVYLCNDKLTLEGKAGDVISVLPYGGNVSGVFLKNLKYPLINAKIDLGRPIGISNEMLGDTCEISVSEGELIVIRNVTI